jgi:molecular chaperone DnaK (HSP70)
MTGRLAIDFGTSNTIIAIWDAGSNQASSFHLQEYGKLIHQGQEEVSLIPSVINYGHKSQKWIGQQVHDKNLYASPQTIRWMKRYISSRSPLKIVHEGQEISPSQAGQDFVGTILGFAMQELGIENEEIAFTVPVEAFEHYEDWLSKISFQIGATRFRLIDEPSAAALGYGVHLQPGRVLLIFDFGGGTMDVSIVMIEDDQTRQIGRRCRVLGKAGQPIGGADIDQWLYQEICSRLDLKPNSPAAVQMSNVLLIECEKIKEALTFTNQTSFSFINPLTREELEIQCTREEFDDLLEKHDLFTIIHQTLRSALNAAYERGIAEENISDVLLIGGSSQIPAVITTLKRAFGREKVKFQRPLDAVACGAAAFIAGVGFYDHIQHDYAIRYINPQTGEYEYRDLVKKGTPYPSEGPLVKLTVKAAYDGQERMGLAIFERGSQPALKSEPVELVFDSNGSARIITLTPQEIEERTFFWMNENNPTFLQTTHPVLQGQPRFDVQFSVDENKRLILTAFDLITGHLVYKNHPVIHLT